MKIGRFHIVKGPNWAFYAITLAAVYFAWEQHSWMPIVWWLVFVALNVGFAVLVFVVLDRNT